MNLHSGLLVFISFPWVKLCAGFILSFIITFLGIPSIVRISEIKGLYDMPGPLTSHTVPTPRLGGAIIFAGVILSSVLLIGFDATYESNCIMAGMIILFLIGVKDDIVSLVPFKKALGQLIASMLIVFAGDIRIAYFDLLITSPALSYVANTALSLLIVMTLINSINLIDGIDGLASGIGIIGSVTFGIWFIISGHLPYAVLCFSLAGSLISFFWYNVFSIKNKIFMGDTGSMIIGFLLSVFVIRFLNINSLQSEDFILKSPLAIALSVIIIPLFDTIRVCLVRIWHRKSIFRGDNNHIHHSVLRISGSHIKSTFLILCVNVILIILTVILRNLGDLLLIFGLIFIIYSISVLLIFIQKNKLKTVN